MGTLKVDFSNSLYKKIMLVSNETLLLNTCRNVPLQANPDPKRLYQFRIGTGSRQQLRILPDPDPVPDPQHSLWLMDPDADLDADPDPSIFIMDIHEVNRKQLN